MKKSLPSLLSGFLLSTLSVIAMAQPELKGNPDELRQFLYPNDRIVTINGQAEKKAYSDKAIVSLVITTEDKLLSTSIANNSELRSAVTDKLVAAGIDADVIKSSKFSSSPQYGWFGKKPDSYKVVNRMAVSIVKAEHLKEIALVADSDDNIELSATSFEHTAKDDFNNQVKMDALDKVMKQKAFYEKSLGVKLTTVGFRDSQIFQRASRGAMLLEEIVLTAKKRDGSDYASVSKGRATQAPAKPSFDEIIYEANLTVDFKIEGNK